MAVSFIGGGNNRPVASHQHRNDYYGTKYSHTRDIISHYDKITLWQWVHIVMRVQSRIRRWTQIVIKSNRTLRLRYSVQRAITAQITVKTVWRRKQAFGTKDIKTRNIDGHIGTKYDTMRNIDGHIGTKYDTMRNIDGHLAQSTIRWGT